MLQLNPRVPPRQVGRWKCEHRTMRTSRSLLDDRPTPRVPGFRERAGYPSAMPTQRSSIMRNTRPLAIEPYGIRYSPSERNRPCFAPLRLRMTVPFLSLPRSRSAMSSEGRAESDEHRHAEDDRRENKGRERSTRRFQGAVSRPNLTDFRRRRREKIQAGRDRRAGVKGRVFRRNPTFPTFASFLGLLFFERVGDARKEFFRRMGHGAPSTNESVGFSLRNRRRFDCTNGSIGLQRSSLCRRRGSVSAMMALTACWLKPL